MFNLSNNILYSEADYNKLRSIYGIEKNSNGLALFVQFDIPYNANSQCIKMCKQMETILRQFNFNFEIICAPEYEDRKKVLLEEFEEVISRIESYDYKMLIVFLIGQTSPKENPNGELSYFLLEGGDSIKPILPKYIHELINEQLSKIKTSIPALIFHTWLSPDSHSLLQVQYSCPDTFYCFVSHDINLLPQDIHLLPFVNSLYEVLKYSPNEKLLLVEFFTEIRDNYFNFFHPDAASCYDSNMVFFSRNTLRYPLLIKDKSKASPETEESRLMEVLPALFFIVRKKTSIEGRWANMIDLIGNIKSLFEFINYTIGEDIILSDIQRFSQALAYNKDIFPNCRFVFVLIITTGDRNNDITFADGTSMGVDEFEYEIVNAFPEMSKVIFFNKIFDSYESCDKSSSLQVQEYPHMLVVHSFEPNQLETSLINNFLLEMNNNYFAELLSILRSSILISTRSTYVQVIDGLRKNVFHNYYIHLSGLVQEGRVFEENCEKATLEGSAQFNFYRLMIVGPKGSGKTSLLRTLIGQSFNENEESTKLLVKHNLLVQKQTLDWSDIGEMYNYIQHFEESRQEIIIKNIARELFQTKQKFNSNEIQQNVKLSDSSPNFCRAKSIDKLLPLDSLFNKIPLQTTSKLKFQFAMSQSSHNTNQKYKSDMLTAWDFAGSNDFFCFHSLFLSPRCVYLLLIDLTKNLYDEVEFLNEDNRNQRRSNLGVMTYLDIYEFWINTIYSVCKSSATEQNQCTTKIILVFSKADRVKNPCKIASKHLEDLKAHMQNKSDAFSLIHEKDCLFVLSSMRRSKEDWKILLKLKTILKSLSDQLCSEQPIPIRWLKLAKDILEKKQTNLVSSPIQYLEEDLFNFLHYFHEIGFFFYKQENILIDIPYLINMIYQIVFVSFGKVQTEIPETRPDSIKFSPNLFEKLVKDKLEFRGLKGAILDLLQLFGILIRCELDFVNSEYFDVPCLLTCSLDDLLQSDPSKPKKLVSKFCISFSDGFLPLSIYYVLLSKCIKRNNENTQFVALLGFHFAILHLCEPLLVQIEFSAVQSKISLSFLVEPSCSFEEEYIISEMMYYLAFLQLTMVEIQTRLIPCGSLANIVCVCQFCEANPIENKRHYSLDQIFSNIASEYISQISVSGQPTSMEKDATQSIFCCEEQRKLVYQYIHGIYPHVDPIYKFTNIHLTKFIFENRKTFQKYLNWIKLSNTLYLFGLVTIHKYSSIVYKDTAIQTSLSEEYLIDMVHKGLHWAYQFYFALKFNSKEPNHQYLCRFIDDFIQKKDEESTLSSNTSKRHYQKVAKEKELIYEMKRIPHGIAFIINIEIFKNNKIYENRTGSKYDIDSLRCVSNILKYNTIVFENLTRKEFLHVLKEIRGRDHSEYDSFICVIMSHGNENEVIFSDGKPLSKEKIVREFSPQYCKGLKGKPRIFLYQACRGTSRAPEILPLEFGDVNVNTEFLGDFTPTLEADKPLSILCSSIEACRDTFIGDSTLHQFASYRDKSRGTYFIQSFCNVINTCSNLEFTHMMMEVRNRFEIRSLAQCTEDTNRLKKQIYF